MGQWVSHTNTSVSYKIVQPACPPSFSSSPLPYSLFSDIHGNLGLHICLAMADLGPVFLKSIHKGSPKLLS